MLIQARVLCKPVRNCSFVAASSFFWRRVLDKPYQPQNTLVPIVSRKDRTVNNPTWKLLFYCDMRNRTWLSPRRPDVCLLSGLMQFVDQWGSEASAKKISKLTGQLLFVYLVTWEYSRYVILKVHVLVMDLMTWWYCAQHHAFRPFWVSGQNTIWWYGDTVLNTTLSVLFEYPDRTQKAV
jgi:hypothetical protein